MGADFIALVPSKTARMSYSTVFEIKKRLIDLVSKDLGDKWERIRSCGTELGNRYAGEVMDNLIQYKEVEPCVKRGVFAFVSHSDCDGTFRDREDIVSIIVALKRVSNDLDEKSKIILGPILENLIYVFDDAYESDGEVQIW